MRIEHFKEPELEFGAGRHVDIRFGLMNCGPLDFGTDTAPKEIKFGIVGTPQTIEGFLGWLESCRGGVEAKASKKPNVFPRFPGIGPEESFRCSIVAPLQRELHVKAVDKLCVNPSQNDLVSEAVEMVLDGFDYLAEKKTAVLICAPPLNLFEAMTKAEPGAMPGRESDEEEETTQGKFDFHHLLKARSMDLRKPIQIILPTTYDKAARRKRKTKPERNGQAKEKGRQIQDDVTIAWNLHTALYYKAGGVPWRLIRDASQLATCFVGISFYKTLDYSRVMTSIAQIFNERGEGVIVRGGTAKVSKEDRHPHLSAEDAKELLKRALTMYRKEHHNFPARIVVHKSSPFNRDEIEGTLAALKESGVDYYDLISLGDSYTRLYRDGNYPPLRGTFLSFEDGSQVLYTRGSVDFFETYPGKYIPLPLFFRCAETCQTASTIAREVLALTKMNWNNTQFDGRLPITLRAARQVGKILKYVEEDGYVESNYSGYM
jgi:hypothetical protein